MMKKGRKSQVLMYGLIAGLIAAIIISYVDDVKTKKEFKTIGWSSIKLVEVSKETQKNLFYIDQSAKYSAFQAIHELAAEGGCKKKENYLGYTLWTSNECVPSAALAKTNFKEDFKKILNEYLSRYELVEIPKDNYNLEFKEKNLIGLAMNSLKMPIMSNEERIGEYSIKPSFKVNLDYDFSDYDKLRANAAELLTKCENKNPEKCIEKNKKILLKNNFQFSSCETEQQGLIEFAEYLEGCVNSEVPELTPDGKEVLGCVCKNRPETGTFNIIESGNDVIIRKEDTKETIKLENINPKGVELENIQEKDFLHKDKETGIMLKLPLKQGPVCILKPKTKFRFCVESKNNKFMHYENGKASMKNVIYKFALDFGEEITHTSPAEYALNTDIKGRIRKIAQEIGFENIELALKLAKTESGFQHCRDETLNCGTGDKINVNCNENKDSEGKVVSRDCGIMQINTKAHEDLFAPNGKRLELFDCNEETVYDFECNIKAGLGILQQYHDAYGSNTERYNNAVDNFCRYPEANKKYKSYTDPWDRALRAYNGFGKCGDTIVAGYVNKVNSAIV